MQLLVEKKEEQWWVTRLDRGWNYNRCEKELVVLNMIVVKWKEVPGSIPSVGTCTEE
jgi:hypothetical protein